MPSSPGSRLHGQVVDERGVAVPAARVGVGRGYEWLHRTVADPNGCFDLPDLPAGEYDLFATCSTRAALRTAVVLTERAACEVRLVVAEAAIRGRVIDAAGAPLAAVEVAASTTGRFHAASHAFDRTDVDGQFVLAVAAQGEYAVTAGRRTYGINTPDPRVRSGTSGVELVVSPPASITGVVTLDGAPLASYGVLVNGHGYVFSAEPTPIEAPDGRFTVEVSAGTGFVIVAGLGTTVARRAEVRGTPGDTVDIGELAVACGVRITGRVETEGGEPVAGARVELGNPSDDRSPLALAMEQAYVGITDATGTFAIDGVDAGGEHPLRLAASHPTLGRSRNYELARPNAAVVVPIELTGAIVGVFRESPGAGRITAASRDERIYEESAKLEPDGTVRIDDLVPGTYDLYLDASARGVQRARTLCGQAVVTSGTQTRVDLAPPPVTITVTFHSSEPRSGLLLVSERSRQFDVAHQSWSAGEVELLGLAPGAYDLFDSTDPRPLPFILEPAPAVQHFDLRDGQVTRRP